MLLCFLTPMMQQNCTCNAGFGGTIVYIGDECTACTAGTYSPMSAPGDCAQCDDTTCGWCRQNMTCSSACASPALTSDPLVPNSTLYCLCGIGYEGPIGGGGPCWPCPAGTFKGLLTGSCQPCSPDSYSPGTMSLDIPAALCYPCPIGTGTVGNFSTQLSDCMCQPGQGIVYLSYSDPSYFFYPFDGSVNYFFFQLADQSDNPSASPCAPCEPGKYTPGLGTAPCSFCPPGTYGNLTGASFCNACPPNATTLPGALALEECTCIPGFEPAGDNRSLSGAAGCLPCPQGSFSNAATVAYTNSGICLLAPGNSTIAPGAAQYNCEAGFSTTRLPPFTCTPCLTVSNCEAGYYFMACTSDSPSVCVPCADYSTSPEYSYGKESCTCNAGYYGPNGGPCTPCTVGQYKDTSGNTSCIICPRDASNGTALASPLASTALNDCTCPPGWFIDPTVGACPGDPDPNDACGVVPSPTGCSMCLPGYYAAQLGQTACEPCPNATYQSAAGQSVCTLCTRAAVTLGIAASEVWQCTCGPGYYGPDGGPCLACRPGTVKAETGPQPCTSCLPLLDYQVL